MNTLKLEKKVVEAHETLGVEAGQVRIDAEGYEGPVLIVDASLSKYSIDDKPRFIAIRLIAMDIDQPRDAMTEEGIAMLYPKVLKATLTYEVEER